MTSDPEQQGSASLAQDQPAAGAYPHQLPGESDPGPGWALCPHFLILSSEL